MKFLKHHWYKVYNKYTTYYAYVLEESNHYNYGKVKYIYNGKVGEGIFSFNADGYTYEEISTQEIDDIKVNLL